MKTVKRVAFLLMAVSLVVSVMGGLVLAAGNPVVYDNWQSGNAEASCARIGVYEFAWKLDDNAPNGVYSAFDNTITILNSTGKVFDWESLFGIGAVIVKAGRGANVWFYDPQVKADTGLYGYQNREISHVVFCWNPEKDGGQWCSPGYWRQPHHLDSWEATGISPDEFYNDHFDPDLAGNPTLWQVLQSPQTYGGAAFNNVGDLLSEAHPDVDFDGERVENSCPLN